MSEKIVDATTIASGGGTTSSTEFDVDGTDELTIRVAASSGGTDLTVAVDSGAMRLQYDPKAALASVVGGDSVSNFDASSDVLCTLNVSGMERCQLLFTNNAASSATITAWAADY